MQDPCQYQFYGLKITIGQVSRKITSPNWLVTSRRESGLGICHTLKGGNWVSALSQRLTAG